MAPCTSEVQLVRLLKYAGNVPSNASTVDPPIRYHPYPIMCIGTELQHISTLQPVLQLTVEVC